MPIEFRPLRREDLGLLSRWLGEPLVARWWAQDSSVEGVEAEFGPALDGRDPTELALACADGAPFGLLQRYPFAAYPEYVSELGPVYPVPEGALSIDYLIGEPAMRGRGSGAEMIAGFVAESWPRYPAARDVVVPVAAGNVASWRALERAGFTRVAEGPLTPDNPIDPPEHVIYRIRRSAP